jgi:hypothetical protein
MNRIEELMLTHSCFILLILFILSTTSITRFLLTEFCFRDKVPPSFENIR